MTSLTDALYPPGAYIIGAPKCGTTALAAYLAEHPAIAFARPKEPHHFADDLSGLKIHEGADGYRASLPVEDDTQVTMDGSVWYLYSERAVAAIELARPDARYIVMLRDPVKMAVSLHSQLLNAFDEEIEDFAEAWRASDARARGERIPRRCRAPSTLVYNKTCALGAQLERFMAQVPEERRLILFQEEMSADSGAVYRRALDFLGLPDDGRDDFPRVNEAAAPRSRALHLLVQRGGAIRTAISTPVKRLLGVDSLGILQQVKQANMVAKERPVIEPGLASEMAAELADDTRKLCSLLGRDVVSEFGWTLPD